MLKTKFVEVNFLLIFVIAFNKCNKLIENKYVSYSFFCKENNCDQMGLTVTIFIITYTGNINSLQRRVHTFINLMEWKYYSR